MQTLFDKIDEDGDGMLSQTEVEHAMCHRKKHLDLKPAIVLRAFAKADVNQDGYIHREEFYLFLRMISYFSNLYRVFDLMDTNHDRHLSRDEFAQAATLLGVQDPQTVFDEMDEHYLGYIVFDDFCLWMAEHQAKTMQHSDAMDIEEQEEEEDEKTKDRATEPLPVSSVVAEEEAKGVSPEQATPVEDPVPPVEAPTSHDEEGELSYSAAEPLEKASIPDSQEPVVVESPSATTEEEAFEDRLKTALTEPNEDDMQELFDEIDEDGDGHLSVKEVEHAICYRKQDTFALKPTIVLRAFEKAYVNQDGTIGRDEFFIFLRMITYFDNL